MSNHVEYFNDFSSGAYDLGDVAFENFTAGFNNKGLYFKTYRRGVNSAPLCTNCSFVRNGIAMNRPGGSALVEFKEAASSSRRAGGPPPPCHHCARAGAAHRRALRQPLLVYGRRLWRRFAVFLDGSDGEQSDVLIFTDTATLLHTHANIAFDNATPAAPRTPTTDLAPTPAAELRIADLLARPWRAWRARARGGGGGAGARANSRCRTARFRR